MPDNRNVAIFWDFENCSPSLSSQAYPIVDGIRRIANVFGSVTKFNTYLDVAAQSSRNSAIFRSELQSSGVSIMDCPHNGRKDVVDKMILVDMLAFALDHKPPATVILIAGDRDYAYGLSTLRQRKYSVVLIVPSPNAPQSLRFQASVVIDWDHAILGKRPEVSTPPLRKFDHDLDEDTVKRLEEEIQHSNEDPAVTLMSSSHPITAGPTHTRWGSAAEPLEPSAFQRSTGSNDAFQPALSYTLNTASGVLPETLGRPRHISRVSPARFTTQSTQADIDRDSSSLFTEDNALSDESAADEYVSTANEIRNATQYSFARPFSMSPRLERYQVMAESSSPPSVNSPIYPSPSALHSMGSRTVPLPSLPHTRTISGGTPLSYGNLPQKRASTAIPLSPTSTGGRSEISSAPTSVSTGSVSSMMDDSVLPSDRAAVMRALGIDDEDEDSFGDESPVLVEDDDPLDAYVMNAVESCSDESRASFDRSTNPSPANDASHLTEPYGTLMFRMSSLSQASFATTTPPPTLAPQATIPRPYQTPSTPPAADVSDGLIPFCFFPLVTCLVNLQKGGMSKPLRSAVGLILGPTIYATAGVSSLKEYLALAVEANIVELGGADGHAWVKAHPDVLSGQRSF